MRRFLFSIVLLLLPAVLSAQTMEITVEPDWVEELPLPAEQPALRAESWDGVHYLLTDNQLRWEGDTRISYYRSVSEVTDRAGLEELGTISEYFDPEFETMSLVRLAIIRDGERIDLMDKISFEVFRRETRLEEGIIDGTLTAVGRIPDLRVGDVIDRATVWTQRPYVEKAGKAGSSTLEWNVPVNLSRSLLYWPKDAVLNVAALPPEVAYSKSDTADGMVRHEWRRESYLPDEDEEAVPDEVVDRGVLRFSDQADWSALSVALTDYYAADYPLPVTWEARVEGIARDHADPADRAMAALRLVQDELRYVSLSVGAGGYFARLPEEVIASGFGDCKDKSLLLRVLLSRLGVTAAVALTDLDTGYGLIEEVPGSGAFDHMIVRIQLDDQAHWVDPTATHEGGTIATRARPLYGYALPLVGPAQTKLELMTAEPAEISVIEATETFRFLISGVDLTVKTVHEAGSADRVRARWATNPASQIERDFLDYYRERYPGLTVAERPTVSDDRDANTVVVTERYFLPIAQLDRNGLREEFVFAPERMLADIPESLDGPRRLPLSPGWPGVYRHMVEVRGAPIEFEPPKDVRLRNPGFDFNHTGIAWSGGNMTLTWEMVIKTHSVPPETAQQVVDDGRQVDEMTWLYWDLRP